MKLEEVIDGFIANNETAKYIGLNNHFWAEIAKTYAAQKCKEQAEICMKIQEQRWKYKGKTGTIYIFDHKINSVLMAQISLRH